MITTSDIGPTRPITRATFENARARAHYLQETRHNYHGSCVMSTLPTDYAGPTEMYITGSSGREAVKFTSTKQAKSAAWYALGPYGGYSNAILVACEDAADALENWQDWTL